ncbi:MAG: IPT/TIG domain-containing protein [Chloroflexi bacterium]|nr:IPT/TIG domain-containing protein [Chloroflexota bacterium]MDA1004388.1 IPT/TIG domain-containing protein [Chloroflexota bacterium]
MRLRAPLIASVAALALLALSTGSAIAAAPTISGTSYSFTLATGGTSVTIFGANFAAGATVAFGGVGSTAVTFVNATQVKAVSPPHAIGLVDITVQNPDGLSATMKNAFTYSATPVDPLTIASVAPAVSATGGGTTVSIAGTGFVDGMKVSFGNYVATSVSLQSSTLMLVTAPVGPSGTVSVVVMDPSGRAALFNGFAYTGTATTSPPPTIPGQPVIGSVTPASGPASGGTTVTITGSGFSSPATVTFRGVAATNVTVVSASQITATTPAGALGPAAVLVSTAGGQVGGLTAGFTYAETKPVVNAVTPWTGASTGGTAISIAGTGFAAGATVTIGGAAASSVVVVSASQITAITPPGVVGAATVLVTGSGGAISGLASAFTYTSGSSTPTSPPIGGIPQITSVTPASGSPAGGTAITIIGNGFVDGASVRVGGAVAVTTVISATQIVASTPAGTAGNTSLIVTNPDGVSAVASGGFTYATTAGSPGSGLSAGASGLFVFAGGSNADLVSASSCPMATVVFWATDGAGEWTAFVPSVTLSVVNAAWNALFPGGIPAATAIYVKCASAG